MKHSVCDISGFGGYLPESRKDFCMGGKSRISVVGDTGKEKKGLELENGR